MAMGQEPFTQIEASTRKTPSYPDTLEKRRANQARTPVSLPAARKSRNSMSVPRCLCRNSTVVPTFAKGTTAGAIW
jgi:hypothetical protein